MLGTCLISPCSLPDELRQYKEAFSSVREEEETFLGARVGPVCLQQAAGCPACCRQTEALCLPLTTVSHLATQLFLLLHYPHFHRKCKKKRYGEVFCVLSAYVTAASYLLENNKKNEKVIFMTFSVNVDNGPRKRW